MLIEHRSWKVVFSPRTEPIPRTKSIRLLYKVSIEYTVKRAMARIIKMQIFLLKNLSNDARVVAVT